MISALSPESVADLRACAEKYGVEAVLAEARQRRQEFLDPQLNLPDKHSLDALVVNTTAGGYCSEVEQRLPPELVVQPPQLKLVLSAERQRWVNRAVRQLPLSEKRVVRMRYWEEMPLREIARVMGFSISRSDQVHKQALSRLRQWFYTNWFIKEAA